MDYGEAFRAKKAGFRILVNAADYYNALVSGVGVNLNKPRSQPERRGSMTCMVLGSKPAFLLVCAQLPDPCRHSQGKSLMPATGEVCSWLLAMNNADQEP